MESYKDEINAERTANENIPDEVEDPVITQLHTTDQVLSLLVSGPMTPSDLKAHAERLKDRIQALSEVSLVSIAGFADHQFRIELSTDALMRHNLSVADVADVISRQNIDLPAGVVETHEQDVLVR